jgi:nitroreductase
MEFSDSIIEIITQRTSWRTYEELFLKEEHLEAIQDAMSEKNTGPFEGNCKFHYMKVNALGDGEKKKIGTYGFIKGAKEFIVATTKRSDYERENLGYNLEKIILYATQLGLGTVWIGGILKRELFEKGVDMAKDEILPAVTPIGYPASRRRLFEKGVRAFIKAGKNKRLSWDKIFFIGNFETPLTNKDAGKYEKVLQMVRYGPSASNKQPWRLLKEGNSDIYHFYIKPAKGYGQFARLDAGIAVCHFDLTAEELKLKGEWKILGEYPEKEDFTYIISWIGQ